MTLLLLLLLYGWCGWWWLLLWWTGAAFCFPSWNAAVKPLIPAPIMITSAIVSSSLSYVWFVMILGWLLLGLVEIISFCSPESVVLLLVLSLLLLFRPKRLSGNKENRSNCSWVVVDAVVIVVEEEETVDTTVEEDEEDDRKPLTEVIIRWQVVESSGSNSRTTKTNNRDLPILVPSSLPLSLSLDSTERFSLLLHTCFERFLGRLYTHGSCENAYCTFSLRMLLCQMWCVCG
jgi:hypothetical protein